MDTLGPTQLDLGVKRIDIVSLLLVECPEVKGRPNLLWYVYFVKRAKGRGMYIDYNNPTIYSDVKKRLIR